MVTKRLNDDRSPFFITDPDPTHFYDTPNFIFYASEDYIYLHLRIHTLCVPSHIWNFTKSITLPVPIHNNQSSNTYTTYKLPKYIAIATSRSYYFELSQDEYDGCTGHPMVRCKHNLPIRSTSQMSCALAMFMDNIDKVPSACVSILLIDNSYLSTSFLYKIMSIT